MPTAAPPMRVMMLAVGMPSREAAVKIAMISTKILTQAAKNVCTVGSTLLRFSARRTNRLSQLAMARPTKKATSAHKICGRASNNPVNSFSKNVCMGPSFCMGFKEYLIIA